SWSVGIVVLQPQKYWRQNGCAFKGSVPGWHRVIPLRQPVTTPARQGFRSGGLADDLAREPEPYHTFFDIEAAPSTSLAFVYLGRPSPAVVVVAIPRHAPPTHASLLRAARARHTFRRSTSGCVALP